MKRTPLRRKTRLTAKHANGKPRTPLKKHNPARQAKRDARMRKWYASAEYKRQRAESLALAGNRCEFTREMARRYGGPLTDMVLNGMPLLRCDVTAPLHMHEWNYRGSLSTPKDRSMLCPLHHALVEQVLHPTRRRSQRKGGGR